MVKRNKTTEIIVHCSATPEGRDYTVETIRKWHLARKFADIGYHYVIYRDGSIHAGRNESTVGAHCTGHNRYSVGICYIGGLAKDGKTAKDTRTGAQKKALRQLIKMLKAKYPTITKVLGHRDTSPDKNKNGKVDKWEWVKECPSFNAREEYKNI